MRVQMLQKTRPSETHVEETWHRRLDNVQLQAFRFDVNVRFSLLF